MRNPLIATFLLAAAAAVPAVFAQQPQEQIRTLSNDAKEVSSILLNKQISNCVAQFQDSGAAITEVASTNFIGSLQTELVITGQTTLHGRPDHLVRMTITSRPQISEHGNFTQYNCNVQTLVFE